MRFAIVQLIVWPRDGSKSPRVLSFVETGINLITGSSRSGKSAIIKIIDYCLGSKTCNIPKLGPIRRSSGWYGIVVATEEGYKLLARRDPDAQDATDEIMLIESATPVFPDRPTKNSNRAAIKGMLARLARLPQSSADFDATGNGFKSRASFGDMTSFVFQPQNIVANENVLFFEANDEEHAPKLREIFPLVLGVVDARTLVALHRLAEVRRTLDRKRRQLEALKGSNEDYAGEVRGRYLGAIDLGLLRADVSAIDQAETGALLMRLVALSRQWLEGQRPNSGPATFANAERLADLRNREFLAAQQVASLRLRHVQLRELSQARQVSEADLARERDRLAPSSWLVEKISDTSACPFCGSPNHVGTSELTRLGERAIAVEAQWNGITIIPPMLDAEEVEIRRALTQEEVKLRQIRAEKAEIEQLTPAARTTEEERALFMGKLLEFIKIQRELSGDEGLVTDIGELEAEEEALRGQVDPEMMAQRKEEALLLISRYARHYGQIVDLEDNDAIIKLDTRELTIRVISEHGESAWLRQLGSGANYLGYHVATLLALHEFFINKPIPYVPSLLIFDQPSQTQFADDSDEEDEQEELIAVRKAFEAFDSAIDRAQGLQIIVSEHAGGLVYEGIKRLTVVERWRRGRKLIPWHWDTQALIALEGRRADAALEDLWDSVLVPALALHVGVTAPSEISVKSSAPAVFARRGIEFKVVVSIHHGGKPEEAPVDSKQQLLRILGTELRTLGGLVRQDLSVMINECPLLPQL